MKSLCITGNTQQGVEQFAHVLAQAGAHAALPAPRSPEVSMADWHQAVLAQLPAGADASQGSMGRIWDQLAGDIFLANRMQALWFWADTRSTALLDFWLGFDLNTRFVLAYTDPATALSQALLDDQATDTQLDERLESWVQATRQMLRFHLRNGARSVLLPAAATAAVDPAAGLQLLSERLGLGGLLDGSAVASVDSVSSGASVASFAAEPGALARHLVSQYLEQHPQALALHEEALACLSTVESDPAAAVGVLDARAALSCLLQEQAQQNSRFDELKTSLEEHLASAQSEFASKLDALAAEKKAEIETLQGKHTALQNEAKEATEENELLLEQLHLVQEELEKAFLDQKSKTEQLKKAQAEGQKLATLDGQFKKAQADLKAANDKVAALNAQAGKLQVDLKAAQDRAGNLDAQLKKVQGELKAAQDRAGSLDAQLKKAQGELKTAQDRAGSLDTQLKKTQGELKTAREKGTGNDSQLKEVSEENDLLLEQLHMVQEELERYYLNLKQAEADKIQMARRLEEKEQSVAEEVATLEARLARVFARNPGYWDCERLAVQPLPAEGGAEIAEWTLTGLETAGRYLPTLRFRTVLRNDAAGLVILREGSGDAPLQRWPAAYGQATELPCVAQAGGPLEGSNLALSSLSPADWDVLKNVVVYLVNRLENTPAGGLPRGIDGPRLMRGLAHFARTLQNWPALLRFRQVSFAPVTSIPNYTGLDIHLEQVCLGEQRLPGFSYRLASVDTVAGQFGQDPRLEFPESSREALDSWFAETSDDRGARLELRFAKPNAFDRNVWARLSRGDQSLVAALMSSLPQQLAALQLAQEGAENPAGFGPRTAQEWQALATWMTHTLAAHIRPARRTAALA